MTDVVGTDATVSSLLETAVSYEYNCGASLQSDSERTTATVTDRKRCICHIGDACQIMSKGFHSMKDPRGCFLVVPSYEVQLREAYSRYLKPTKNFNEEKDDLDIDEDNDFVVAMHHFHPTVIEQCFDTDSSARLEDDLLPMPMRTIRATGTAKKSSKKKDKKSSNNEKALEGLLVVKLLEDLLVHDSNRVVNHQTGVPIPGEYWVVPSYSFDATHEDLKQGMGNMPQLDLERCIRRMKREARRQKWEAICHKWDQVSKRANISTRSIRAGAETPPKVDALLGVPPSQQRTAPEPYSRSKVDALLGVVPPSQQRTAPEPYSRSKVDALLGVLPSSTSRGGVIQNPPTSLILDPQASPVPQAQVSAGVQPVGTVEKKIDPKPEEEEPMQVSRASILTAQEVLESELGDDDSIPDLNEVDEPESSESKTEFSTGSETNDLVPEPVAVEEEEAESTPQDPTSDALAPYVAAETPVQKEEDKYLSSLSNEGSAHDNEQGGTGEAEEKADSDESPVELLVVEKNTTESQEEVSEVPEEATTPTTSSGLEIPEHWRANKALEVGTPRPWTKYLEMTPTVPSVEDPQGTTTPPEPSSQPCQLEIPEHWKAHKEPEKLQEVVEDNSTKSQEEKISAVKEPQEPTTSEPPQSQPLVVDTPEHSASSNEPFSAQVKTEEEVSAANPSLSGALEELVGVGIEDNNKAHEEEKVLPKQEVQTATRPKQSKLSNEIADLTSTSADSVSTPDTIEEPLLIAPSPVLEAETTALQTIRKASSFLKSLTGTAVVVGMFCVYTVGMLTVVHNCTGVLKSRDEALA